MLIITRSVWSVSGLTYLPPKKLSDRKNLEKKHSVLILRDTSGTSIDPCLLCNSWLTSVSSTITPLHRKFWKTSKTDRLITHYRYLPKIDIRNEFYVYLLNMSWEKGTYFRTLTRSRRTLQVEVGQSPYCLGQEAHPLVFQLSTPRDFYEL